MASHPSTAAASSVSLEPIGPTPIHVRPSLSYAGIPINLTKHEVNALAPLTASIWPNQGVGVAVPLLEVIAHGLLVTSLAAVLLCIALHRRKHKRAVADSWESLPAADVAVRCFLVIAGADLFLSALVFLVMCLPVEHNGAYVAFVYAGTLRETSKLAPPPPLSSPSNKMLTTLFPPFPLLSQFMASSTTSRGSAACTSASQSRGRCSVRSPSSSSPRPRASLA